MILPYRKTVNSNDFFHIVFSNKKLYAECLFIKKMLGVRDVETLQENIDIDSKIRKVPIGILLVFQIKNMKKQLHHPHKYAANFVNPSPCLCQSHRQH